MTGDKRDQTERQNGEREKNKMPRMQMKRIADVPEEVEVHVDTNNFNEFLKRGLHCF